jgi:hypothetical protein
MTGPDQVITITTAPVHRRPWGRLRGAWAVAALLLTALGHLIAAALGIRPIAWTGRRLIVPLAAAYRSASRLPVPPPAGSVLAYTARPTSEKES